MRPWRSLYLIAWVVWLIDLGTKIWAEKSLSSRANIEVLGSFLQLTFIRNSGAAFSIGTGKTIIFTIFALVVLILITRYAAQITSKGWATVGGLLLGGILGNLTDRIFR
jgi:signal peptidase II